MNEYINKNCKIHININNKDLFFSEIINNVSDIHIFFKDKFGGNYCFRKSDVVEINVTKEV